MKKGYSYPLPEEALAEFCHPERSHIFGAPARMGREVVAANGYVVLRASRGRWIDADYPEAHSEFVKRVEALPWVHMEATAESKWVDLERVKTKICARPRLGMWSGTRVGASPVWLVGDVLCRLSVLQLVALLPRVQVAWSDRALPLWFRFSGGVGAIAVDWRLRDPSTVILQSSGPIGFGSIR